MTNNNYDNLEYKEGRYLTWEPISKYFIGKFSLRHSILWKTMRTCLAFLGLSSSFDASHTQPAATFCQPLSYPRTILDEEHGWRGFMLFLFSFSFFWAFQVNETITYSFVPNQIFCRWKGILENNYLYINPLFSFPSPLYVSAMKESNGRTKLTFTLKRANDFLQ
jgi:hypothetical protein